MSCVNWYNFPSIVCLCTIIRNVKSHTVTINCYFRSYVIFLLILPLCHLKCKSITLKSVKQGKNLIFTYWEANLQIFGNHKVAVVPVVSQVFNCEVDLSTVLTRMFIMFHFFCDPRPTEVGSGKYSILIAKGK